MNLKRLLYHHWEIWRTVKMETEKMNHVLTYISTYCITKLNELIYGGANLVSEKIGVPEKARRKISKPGWEIQHKTQIKRKLRKQAQIIKERKDSGTCRDTKRQHNKNNNTTWGNKPESIGERRKIKKISTKGKTIQTKLDIPK